MGTEWDDLVHDLALDMAELEYRQFLIIEYNAQLDLNPYAQATPTASGDWMCEVVSVHYLGPAWWPLDEFTLARCGWTAPQRSEDNWSNSTADPESAALMLVEALRDGRQCADPRVFTWLIDRFPPPGDDGEHPPALPRGPFGLAA